MLASDVFCPNAQLQFSQRGRRETIGRRYRLIPWYRAAGQEVGRNARMRA